MQIIIPEQIGFCKGVENTINIAKDFAHKNGEVFTYGKLIHNDRVIEDLKKENIFPLDNISDILSKDNILIRTHGVSREDFEILKSSGKNIIDGTCPFVKKIHKMVEEFSDNGYHIIIYGDITHPEVKGIKSYAKKSTVLTDIDEHFPFENSEKYFIVSQTTQDNLLFENFIEKFKKINKNFDKIVEFMNTICYTTKVRQFQSIEVAKKSDVVLVIGDKNSSNTNKLYDLAKKYCENVYFITTVTELLSVANKNITYLGILTGASTPKELIMEVLKRMADNNITINNEEVNVTLATNDVAETPVEETAVNAVIEAVEEKKAEPFTMEQAMKKYSNKKNIREGSKVKAMVVSIEDTGLMVSVSGLAKNDSGFIDKDELCLEGTYDKANYQVGQEIETIVIPKNLNDKNNKGLNLSKKKLDALKIDDEAVKQILEGAEFTLSCNQEIKGGLLGKLGSYSIFVPASQIKMGFVKNLKDFVDKPLRLKALPPKEEELNEDGEPKHQRNNKRIVASQRVILEEEKAAKEDAFWSIMQVNNIVSGKVKRFSAFGAFVQVMGFDCLAHISDLSWTKIKEPADILELGKSYDFVVLKADKEANKVSIGFKQLQKKPYEIAADKYPVGTVINGKVERIFPFGAFVEIEPGIDGLVHVSQIGHKFIKNASEALKIGEEIQAKIIGFENNKITLSIKELTEAPDATDSSDNNEDRPARKRFKKDKDDNEPREWVNNNSGATLADLFKDLDLDFKDE